MPDHAKALKYAQTPKTYSLTVCRWEGGIRCVYLNDFRIAGGKPWGGGQIAREFKGITLEDLSRAIPEIANLQKQLAEARKEQHEASWKAAIEAAARIAPAYDSRVVADHIRALPIEPMVKE